MAHGNRSHFVMAVWKHDRSQARDEVVARMRSVTSGLAPWTARTEHARSFDVVVLDLGPAAAGESTGERTVDVYPLVGVSGSLGDVLSRGRQADILPPYAGLTFDPTENRFCLVTDYVGIGRVYHHETEDAHLFASRLTLLCGAAGLSPVPDPAAALTFGAVGWVMGSRTIVQGIELLAPCARIELGDAVAGQRTLRWTHGTPLVHEPRGADPELVVAHLVESVASIAHVYPGELSSTLSGGRDSRLVAALLSEAGLRFRCWTTDNFPDETEIARAVHARLRCRGPLEVRPPASPADADDVLTSVRSLVRHHEGMFEPSYIGRITPPVTNLPDRPTEPSLGGAGGELAHGHYYPRATGPELASLSRTDAVTHLVRRVTSLGTASQHGTELVCQHVTALADNAAAHGFEGVKLLDFFYLHERLRRWSGLAEVSAWHIAPLTSFTFAREALAQSAADASTSLLHRTLIDRLVPGLADVPFFKTAARSTGPSSRPRFPADGAIRDYLRSSTLCATAIEPARVERALAACAAGTQSATDEAAVKRALWLAAVEEWLDVR